MLTSSLMLCIGPSLQHCCCLLWQHCTVGYQKAWTSLRETVTMSSDYLVKLLTEQQHTVMSYGTK